jgi:hypothetical protein
LRDSRFRPIQSEVLGRMRIPLAWLLLAASVRVASASETCTCGQGDSLLWTQVGTTPGGLWDDCWFPGGDDAFVIGAGCTVRVCAPGQRCTIAFDPANAQAVTVQPGGALVLRPGRVDLPAGGLDCQGDCTFEPVWRSWAQAPPAVQSDPYASPAWRAGTPVPCPGFDGAAWRPDCAGLLVGPGQQPGDPNHLMLMYPDAAPELAASIAAIAPSGEFVQFVRPPGAGFDDMSMENAHWYEITGRGSTGGAAWLVLNVLQTEQARPRDGEYPLARRRIATVTGPASPAARSEREIAIAESDVVTFVHEYAGTCAYRVDPALPGGVDPLPAVLSSTEDGAPDRITVAAAEGWPWDLAPQQKLYLAHFCIRPGDPFVVVSPAILSSASPAQDDTPLFFGGAAPALVGLLASQVSHVVLPGPGTATISHSAVWDASGGDQWGVAVTVDAGLTHLAASYLNVVGGREQGAELRGPHAMQAVAAGGSTTSEIDDYSVRYHGDDALVFERLAVQASSTIRRIHASFLADNAESANLIDVGSRTTVDVAGAVCKSCVSRDWDSVEIGIGDDQDDGFVASAGVDGFLSVGASGNLDGAQAHLGCWEARPELSFCSLRNATIVDGHGRLAPIDRFEAFVVRGSRSLGPLLELGDVDGIVWRDGVVADAMGVSGQGGLIDAFSWSTAPKQGNLFENILWLDLHDLSPYPLQQWRLTGAAGTRQAHRLRRTTIAFSERYRALHPNGHWSVVMEMGTSHPSLWSEFYFDGVLVTGYNGGAAPEVALQVNAETLDNSPSLPGPCLSENAKQDGSNADVNAAFDPGDAPNTVRFTDLGLFADFSPHPAGMAEAVDCGIRAAENAPGVRSKGWEHFIAGLEPEFLGRDGLDPDGDGLVNGDERASGTDPALWDTDGDGLGDGEELFVHGTDPRAVDTDGDHYSDGGEVASGTDPLDPASHPLPIPALGAWALAAGSLCLLLLGLRRARAGRRG